MNHLWHCDHFVQEEGASCSALFWFVAHVFFVIFVVVFDIVLLCPMIVVLPRTVAILSLTH